MTSYEQMLYPIKINQWHCRCTTASLSCRLKVVSLFRNCGQNSDLRRTGSYYKNYFITCSQESDLTVVEKFGPFLVFKSAFFKQNLPDLKIFSKISPKDLRAHRSVSRCAVNSICWTTFMYMNDLIGPHITHHTTHNLIHYMARWRWMTHSVIDANNKKRISNL